jgi:hypothetical protein
MAGAYLTYRLPIADGNDDGENVHLGSAGVDLKPAFVPRWAMDLQRGPAMLDLFLDSISLAAGAFVALSDSNRSTRARGFEASVGAGVPLLAQASGPWFEARYVLGWTDADNLNPSVWLTLSWHFLIDTELANRTGAVD